MATIQTAISMTDNMSMVLNNIANSANSLSNRFEAMQTVVDRDIDASNFNGIREQINAATIAAQQFESELANIQPKSVPVEIEWKTPQNIEIFEGNGVQRYQQEVLSANNMLNRLTTTQQTIAQRAANMQIIPPKAIFDITSMGSRIQALQGQIEQVLKKRIEVVGVERANAEVEQLREQLNNAVQVQEEMNNAIDEMDVSKANQAYNQLNSIITATEKHIRNNTNEQKNFNEEMKTGESVANSLKGVLGAMAGIFTVRLGVKWIQESLDLTNQQINAEQQLANVLANQGADYADFVALKEEAAAIQNNTMYGDEAMIGGAAELSTYIKDASALKSMMGTLANYAAGMSGGAEVSYQQMVDYATQLGKALDGTYDGLKKKGFELSDTQKAIIDSSSLDELIEQGVELSAEYQQLVQDNYDHAKAMVIDEVISQSWANLADQMAQTPQGMLTSMSNAFGDIREQIGAQLYPVILTLFAMIQEHMPQIQGMLTSFVPAIEFIIGMIGQIIEVAFAVYQFFANNWSMTSPIIYGIAAAIILWKIVTIAMTIQQWALNSAIMASGIGAIIIVIGLIVAAIAMWIQKVGGLRVAWLIVVNAVLTAWDWVKIGFFTGVYFVLDLWDKMKLGMMTAGTAIANFMGDMKANVLMILQNMVNGAIDIINGFIGVLNLIPGVNIGLIEQVSFGTQAQLENEAAKQAREDSLNDYRDEIDGNIAERAGKLEEMKNDAWAATTERLAEIEEAKAAAQQKEDAQTATTPSDYVYTNFDGIGQMDTITNGVSDIASNTSKTADFSEENLKYLRDIAERDAINKFTIAEVQVDFGGVTNNINNEMDLDGVTDYIADGTREALEIVMEGVHK